MVDTNDHCLPAFDVRNDPQVLATEMQRYPTLVKPKKDKASEKPKNASDEKRAAKRQAVKDGQQ